MVDNNAEPNAEPANTDGDTTAVVPAAAAASEVAVQQPPVQQTYEQPASAQPVYEQQPAAAQPAYEQQPAAAQPAAAASAVPFRKRKGLMLTSIIVGSVIVLAGAFGGGIAVGTQLPDGGPGQGEMANFGGGPGGNGGNGGPGTMPAPADR